MITHIVLFKFATSASEAEIDKVCGEFNQLAIKCKNEAGETYIKSLKSGTNISIENFSKGFTHAFVVTFSSLEDRDYYVQNDPVHFAFTKTLSAVEDVVVVDFEG